MSLFFWSLVCFWNGTELENDRITALEQLSQLPGAPSVGMHDVPRQSVGEHLGFGKDDDLGRDELDDRLARELLSFPSISSLPSLTQKNL